MSKVLLVVSVHCISVCIDLCAGVSENCDEERFVRILIEFDERRRHFAYLIFPLSLSI